MDRELEVRTATYGPGIDQSQHAKSVSHIIKYIISLLKCLRQQTTFLFYGGNIYKVNLRIACGHVHFRVDLDLPQIELYSQEWE